VDKREIADLLTITKYLNGLAMRQSLGKDRDHARILRLRILARTVQVEEAQSNRRDAMHGAGNARVKFAGELVDAIGAQWLRAVLLTNWNASAVAIDRRRRRVDDRYLAAVTQTARLIENIDRAGEVHLMRSPPLAVGPGNRSDSRQMKAAVD